MDNGEYRFRLVADDGSGYVRTVAPGTGAWQNSHYHKYVVETYIVQSGWVAIVELQNDSLTWYLLMPGEILTTRAHVPHNMYMAGDSVTHTVKHGPTTDGSDWHPSPELDRRTKHVSENDIYRLAQPSPTRRPT